jgi:hypothetical protein
MEFRVSPIKAKHFVDAELPPAQRALIPQALRTAYAAVDQLYQQEPLFSVRSALINKGHVVAWAVDRQIERLLTSGQLPYPYRWTPFQRPTGEYLQITLPTSTLSISQLPSPTDVPRHAFFRQNRILSNAPFLNLDGFEDEMRISGLPHLLLTHGYQTFTFAHIGVLHPEANRFGWIYRTPNLLKEPHVVETEMPPEEAADAEAVVTLRDDITRWVREQDQ